MRDENGKFRFIVTQPLIQGVQVKTQADVDALMNAKGLERTGRESYSNALYQVHDVHAGNTLKDENGNVFVIDAVPKMGIERKPFRVVGTSKTPGNDRPLYAFAPKTDERNLIVAHNLSERSLLFTDKLGGLAMPSLAITTKDSGFDGYGEITLLADKALAQPSGKNPVTDADMYSPRYPSATYKVDEKHAQKYHTKVLNTWNENYSLDYFEKWQSPDSIYSFISNIEDSGVSYLENNEMVMARFLEENGIVLPKDPKELKPLLRSDKYSNDFAAYVENDVLPNIADLKLFKGRTNSGKKQYADYTLENTIKKMKSQMKEGEGFNYGAGTLRSKAAKKFRTIKEIQSARGQITTKEAIKEKKEEMSARLADLATDYQYTYKYSGRFGYLDEFTSAVAEGIQKHNLKRALEEYGFDITESEADLQPIVDYVEELRTMPTEYFEAKPQRAVGLNEFSVAVVPSGISTKAREVLKKNGLKIVEYDSSDKTARQKAIDTATGESPDLLFNKALSTPEAKSLQEDAKKEAQLTDDLIKILEKDFDKQSLKRARIYPDGRMNEEAYFLIAHAHNMAFTNAGIGGWHGVFLNPGNVQKVRRGLAAILGNTADRMAIVLGKRLLRQYDAAIKPNGGMTQVATSENVPNGTRRTWQEETGHEHDFFEGDRHAISDQIFTTDEIGNEAIDYLGRVGSPYEGGSRRLLAREVGAKIRRDDAKQELNLTDEKLEHLQRLQVKAFRDKGVSKATLLKIAKEIKYAGETDVEKTERTNNKRTQRIDGGNERNPESEVYSAVRGSGRTKLQPATRNAAETLENGQNKVLSSDSGLLEANRSEGLDRFIKPANTALTRVARQRIKACFRARARCERDSKGHEMKIPPFLHLALETIERNYGKVQPERK